MVLKTLIQKMVKLVKEVKQVKNGPAESDAQLSNNLKMNKLYGNEYHFF